MRVDGAAVERLLEVADRPLVSVFLPDRLELIKGAPALRRAHLDQFVAALWPARAATRRAYAQTLAQRNALIARIRAGARLPGVAARAGTPQLAAPGHRADGRPARRGRRDRRAVHAPGRASSGLDGDPAVAYRPRSQAAERRRSSRPSSPSGSTGDLERGFTGHGPHRDDLATLARTGASCAPTARRASSGWHCSRCCWPSARRSPPPATPRR